MTLSFGSTRSSLGTHTPFNVREAAQNNALNNAAVHRRQANGLQNKTHTTFHNGITFQQTQARSSATASSFTTRPPYDSTTYYIPERVVCSRNGVVSPLTKDSRFSLNSSSSYRTSIKTQYLASEIFLGAFVGALVGVLIFPHSVSIIIGAIVGALLGASTRG